MAREMSFIATPLCIADDMAKAYELGFTLKIPEGEILSCAEISARSIVRL
jgi:hypothetical protein